MPAATVFVFPSRTDTFGLVLLEALAAGVPVAAHDVTGPARRAGRHRWPRRGAVSDDLRAAALAALGADRAACRAHAERFSWQACAQAFLDALVPLDGVPAAAADIPSPALPRSASVLAAVTLDALSAIVIPVLPGPVVQIGVVQIVSPRPCRPLRPRCRTRGGCRRRRRTAQPSA